MNVEEWRSNIEKDIYPEGFERLYQKEQLLESKNRLRLLLDSYMDRFGNTEIIVISSPGRAELLGNFQDNGAGHTLSAAITKDVLVVAGRNKDKLIAHTSLYGDSLDMRMTDLPDSDEVQPHRWHNLPIGIAYQLFNHVGIDGIQMVIDGNVPEGGGCSSSAATENGIVFAIDRLYDLELTIHQMAATSKRAENLWMKKGCGFLDQLTSLIGGVVYINYENEEAPEYQQLPNWFPGWSLVTAMVDSGHHGSPEDYNSIRKSFNEVAKRLGQGDRLKYDNDLFEKRFPGFDHSDISYKRGEFFREEYNRVTNGRKALEENDAVQFGLAIRFSGLGSKHLLGNTTYFINRAVHEVETMPDTYARVHGGGFGGGIICFTKHPDSVVSWLENHFGKGCAHIHGIRPGVVELKYREG